MTKKKKTKKKPTKKKNRSRTIPKKITEKVRHRHFFECAWCGIKLTERHHIMEWHLGGEHTEENLILLCPNDHTLAHNGTISAEELKKRKSTHLKGDRIQGVMQTTAGKLKFRMGNNWLINVERHLLAHIYQPLLSIDLENETILFSANLFNRKQELIFWMRRNMFWAPSEFEITYSRDFLHIYNKKERQTCLKLYKVDDYVEVEYSSFIEMSSVKIAPGRPIVIRTEYLHGTFSNSVIESTYVGLWLCNPKLHSISEFLRINNESTKRNEPGLYTADTITESLEYHKKTVEQFPDSEIQRHYLGLTLLRAKLVSDAMIAFEKAIEINPTYYPSLNSLALIYYEAGNYGKSLEYFERRLESRPEYFDDWEKFATVFDKLGLTNNAINARNKQWTK